MATFYTSASKASHWTGLEIHEPYVTRYDLTRKYDALIVGDVRAYTWPRNWDMVIFGNVLEHLDLPEAMNTTSNKVMPLVILGAIVLQCWYARRQATAGVLR